MITFNDYDEYQNKGGNANTTDEEHAAKIALFKEPETFSRIIREALAHEDFQYTRINARGTGVKIMFRDPNSPSGVIQKLCPFIADFELATK